MFGQHLNGSCTSSMDRYDTSSLDCDTCGTNQVASSDGVSCVCSPGYKSEQLSGTTALLSFNCTSCMASGMASSQDGSQCVSCQNDTSFLDVATGYCTCRTAGQVLVETDAAGNYLDNVTCASCPSGTLVLSSDPYTCASCSHEGASMQSDGTCVCSGSYTQAGDDWCVLSSYASPILSAYPLSTAQQLTFANVVNEMGGSSSSTTLSSRTVAQLFLSSTSDCSNLQNRSACNALANLCSLASYDTSHATCANFQALVTTSSTTRNATHGFDEWLTSMPLLYYSDASTDALTFSVAVGTQLRFLVAMYGLNGTYLGYEELDGHLQLCGRNPDSLNNWAEAGTNYENSCVRNLDNIVDGVRGTTFYSLFVADADLSQIYPVPIEVDGVSSQVGRFFVLDVNGSIESADANPTIFNYAQDVKLTIPIRDGSQDMLGLPTLSIKYQQRAFSSVYGGNGDAELRFRVVYTGDYEGIWTASVALFSIAIVAISVLWLAECYVFFRVQSLSLTRFSWTSGLQLGIALFSKAANVLLLLVSGMAILSLLLFKGQSQFYLVLPPADGSRTQFFQGLVVFIWAGKTIGLAEQLWHQLHTDVFFFDWEKPRRSLGDAKGAGSVSVWRRILVINKYDELQSARLVNVPLTLFLLLFFLVALGLENVGLNIPAMRLYVDGVPKHPALRFALVALGWFVLGLGQLTFRRSCYDQYVTDVATSFVDLLHSGNISCLVVDDSHHGFYIHGKTVHRQADTDLKDLNRQIASEERCLVKERGLLPGKDTWEVFLHPRFRREYERMYKKHLRKNLIDSQNVRRDIRRATEMRLATQRTAGRGVGRGGAQGGGGMQRRNSQVDIKMGEGAGMTGDETKLRDIDEKITVTLIDASERFNEFLKDFVMGNHQEHAWMEKSPSFCLRAFGLPPHLHDSDGRTMAGSVFYHDQNHSFTQAFLMGIEWQLVTFLLTLHAVCDFAFNSTIVSILIVAVVDALISQMRRYFGRDNLAKKTMLHERFFL